VIEANLLECAVNILMLSVYWLSTYVATDHMDKLAKDSTRDVLDSLLDILEVCLYILYDMLRTSNSLNYLLEILLFSMYCMFNSWRFADYLLKIM
jgi:hypothetical protein